MIFLFINFEIDLTHREGLLNACGHTEKERSFNYSLQIKHEPMSFLVHFITAVFPDFRGVRRL